MKELEREILIIGAGPAGLSAAIEAAKAGAKVTVADEHDTIGGQLYKQIHKFFGAADNHAGMRGFEIARKLEQEAKELGVEFWLSTVAYGIFKEGVGIVRDGDNFIVKAKKVIVAAGGIENTTAFPGSTLPGVMLAGAAQTMANIHRVLPGKRMVVVGSGNVGLIVAYQMLQAGAEVLAVVERDDHIGGYGVHAERLRTAGVPIFTDTVIKCASGKTSVVKQIAGELVVDEKDVVEMNRRLGGDSSLNVTVGDEEDEREKIDMLVDKRQNLEAALACKQEAAQKHRMLQKCLSRLPEREAYIIRHRMLTETPQTLEEIGARFEVSRERVRQIEKKAFEHLSALVKEAAAETAETV